jgi:hypothetical protein
VRVASGEGGVEAQRRREGEEGRVEGKEEGVVKRREGGQKEKEEERKSVIAATSGKLINYSLFLSSMHNS